MKWIICFSIAFALFITAITLSIVKAKKKSEQPAIIKPIYILMAGVFLTAFTLFVPLYLEFFEQNSDTSTQIIKTILLSVHNTIRLFVIDSDFEAIKDVSVSLDAFTKVAYPTLFSIVYVLAPILTFSFILSFFKNIVSYIRYALLEYKSDAYIFSELNEYSATLAKDIAKNYEKDLKQYKQDKKKYKKDKSLKKPEKRRKIAIIFTDVYKAEDEQSSELIDSVQAFGAICFKKDITFINFSFHSKKTKLTFFILNKIQTESNKTNIKLNSLEDENIKSFTKLRDNFKDRDNTAIYLFSRSKHSDLAITTNAENKIKVRRINPSQALIYHDLFENGHKLFKAAKDDGTGTKIISAVIVGMGNYGSTLARTLAWFCQMDGYSVKINAFDYDKDAKSIFASACPELMDEKYNGVYVKDEAEYSVNVYGGINYLTKEFDDLISQITDATYVFVGIGSDEKNIDCAVKLRTLFERMGIHPEINAVVYNTEQKEALTGAVNFKGKPYDITYIGDIETTYSEKVIIDNELEEEGLKIHTSYEGAKETDYWNFEYNYRSSIASAIHNRARIACGITGVNKTKEEMTDEEKNIIKRLEHRRWNAYMRSEGYVYSPIRNDLGKMHTDLVHYDNLSKEKQDLDLKVGASHK